MNFLELAKDRWSVRKFKPEQITEDELSKILEAGKYAPTAVNFQPQKIYILKSNLAMRRINSVCKCVFGAPMTILLKDIKELFEDAHLTKFEQKISQRLNEIDEEIRNLEIKKTAGLYLRNRILQGGDILAHYNEDIDSTQNDSMGLITVEYIPQGQLFYSRNVMEKYQNSEVSLERWIDITENCRERNLSIISPIIVTYYSNALDQYLMKDCDVEFGVMVEGEKIQEKESVRLFGGFEAVTKIHVGSYRNIMESHVHMIQWINKNDYEISGPISEEFIVSPVDIDNENEHITKIIIPVKKK